MEINTIQRPSLLPAVCAPSATWLPITAPVPAQAPRVHQVQIQAELAEALVSGSGAAYGFKGINALSAKRMTDGGSGTPPRGRPV